jgi:Zn-dependent protease with chaperone function
MTRTTWEARYYGGRVAERESVTVTVAPTGLRLDRADGSTLWWPYHEIRQTEGSMPGEPVRLERGEDPVEALVLDDPGVLDAIRQLAPAEVAGHFKGFWGRLDWRRFAALVAAVLAFGAGLYLWGIPLLADRLAAKVPVSWEEELGRSARDQILTVTGRCTDSLLLSTVERLVEQLAIVTPSPYQFRTVISASDQVNAFAAPGGYMVVNRGLIRRTARPEELAGVLAHEMQHVLRRHGTRAILRQIPTKLVLAALAGDVVGASQAAQALGTLGNLRYQRGDEEQADELGVALLHDAGVDATGMANFFATLQREAGDMPRGLAYLSTHPRTEARIERTRQLAAATIGSRPLLPGVRWEEVRQRCGGAR